MDVRKCRRQTDVFCIGSNYQGHLCTGRRPSHSFPPWEGPLPGQDLFVTHSAVGVFPPFPFYGWWNRGQNIQELYRWHRSMTRAWIRAEVFPPNYAALNNSLGLRPSLFLANKVNLVPKRGYGKEWVVLSGLFGWNLTWERICFLIC